MDLDLKVILKLTAGAHLAKRFLNLGIAFANLDMSGSGQS